MKQLVILFIAISLCLAADDHGHEHISITPKQLSEAGIKRGKVRAGTVKKRIEMLGQVQWNSEAVTDVRATYGGRLLSMKVRTGQRVRKGQHLATIENRETLTTYRVTAPQSGVVLERLANRGAVVEGGDALLTIADIGSLWVDLELYSSDLAYLTEGLTVDLSQLNGGLQAEATIAYALPELNPNGTIAVRAVLTKPQGFRPGMVVKGSFLADAAREVPVVLTSAVQFVNGKSVLFVPESATVFVPLEV